jgi:hypothetical protein
MTKADPLPPGYSVSITEDLAAGTLIGRNQDTGKSDTYGIVNGDLVVVDYGWWVARAKSTR